MIDPQKHLAGQLRDQARACAVMGSPMYGDLLNHAAEDVLDGGVSFSLLQGHILPGRGDAIALRYMAAVHRLVLEGRDTPLGELYPSVTGERYDRQHSQEYWEAFHHTLQRHQSDVAELLEMPCQTNEVGRCAVLIGGFLAVAARFELPLRLLEVGASAGLNLRWDQFRYRGAGGSFGPDGSPVQLTQQWNEPPPDVDAQVTVEERRGCDLRPVDPTTEEGALRIRSSIWADQIERMRRLDGAIAVARRVPAPVDNESLDVWIERQLATPARGRVTVVYHSIVEEYLSDEVHQRFLEVLDDAARRAGEDAPLVHLRLESISDLRHHGCDLRIWPGGERRIVAQCGAHGQDVVWK